MSDSKTLSIVHGNNVLTNEWINIQTSPIMAMVNIKDARKIIDFLTEWLDEVKEDGNEALCVFN